MPKHDHTAQHEFHYAGAGYTIVVHRPGAQHIVLPKGLHFLDIHLGRSAAGYTIVGLESAGTASPPSSIVFLPAGEQSEIVAARSGWSVQMTFEPQRLEKAVSRVLGGCAIKMQGVDLRAICHTEDSALVGVAHTLTGIWRNDIALPDKEQLDAVAHLFVMGVAFRIAIDSGPRMPIDGASPRIRPVLDHIENNLTDALSLDTLASIAGISPYHFARVFRRSIGRSPHQYVIERRLAQAKRRLNQSDDPIAVIAHDCGFSSQSHMTDSFSKILGVTPGAVRKHAN